MATLATILRKDKINKKGKAPIHFRIIKNRKVQYISTGIFIDPKFWDDKRDCLKPNHPSSRRMNSFLSNKFTQLQDQVFEFETASTTLSSAQLKSKLLGKNAQDFLDFAEKDLQKTWSNGKIGTHDKNRSIVRKLRKYLGNKSFYFRDMNLEFLLKYEQYLKDKLNNSTNTVFRDMKYFRKLFNEAIRQDIIDISISPFPKYRMKSEKTYKTYLTEKELDWIDRYPATPYTRIDLHRDMFVFAAYTGGLRVSDVIRLQRENFDGTHLHIGIQKTRRQLSIFLPNRALEIIQKWKDAPNASKRFIFPALYDTIDMDDLVELDRRVAGNTAYINRNLKKVIAAVGIKKNVSFHTSRHTWATRALRKGIPFEQVSRLMGHASLRETQIYAKIVNEELDKAMQVFNE